MSDLINMGLPTILLICLCVIMFVNRMSKKQHYIENMLNVKKGICPQCGIVQDESSITYHGKQNFWMLFQCKVCNFKIDVHIKQ